MDRNRIKRIITVYVPGHLCNLRCSYCYVTECLKYSMDGHAQFNYSVEHMIKAFEPPSKWNSVYCLSGKGNIISMQPVCKRIIASRACG